MKTTIDERMATQGEIDPGEYEFTTGPEERITITRGSVEIKLPGELEFRRYATGDMIVISPASSFTIRATELVSYYCIYIDPQPAATGSLGVPDEFDDDDCND